MACPWPSRQDCKSAAGQSKEPAVLLRAVVVSLCLKVIAIANGALREMLLSPRLGARIGHAPSTLNSLRSDRADRHTHQSRG
jgi:hypothetical protein